MKRCKVSVSSGAIFLLALFYFFDDSGLLAAFVPAVLAHEAGHVLLFCAFGWKLNRLRVDLTGLWLDYRGGEQKGRLIVAAAGGPALGFLYAVVASVLGREFQSEFLLCSAGLSFALSVFNLLPAHPLDGGRIFGAMFGENALDRTGFVIALLLMVAGLWCLRSGYGAALLPAGLWILFWWAGDTCKSRQIDVQ